MSARSRRLRVRGVVALALLGASAAPRTARAVDLPDAFGKPTRLDITNFSVVAQRFNARESEGERFEDQGYGYFLNRLNLGLHWDRWTLGARLDSALYWLRPADRGVADPARQQNLVTDGTSRFRDSLFPAKLWVAYNAPGLEVTLGDAYVQLGRGLVLSLRKIDDLGLDTTVRGAKVQIQKDPFAITLFAGTGNPSRVDEATGRALFLPQPTPGDSRSPQPLFGHDRIYGGEIQAGRGLPILLSTHLAGVFRCAPYAYDASGRIVDNGAFAAELAGACDEESSRTWLDGLPSSYGPLLGARDVLTSGQSFEIPRLWTLGTLYAGGALQRWSYLGKPTTNEDQGRALYLSHSGTFGPVTSTLEVKSYRNFYNVSAAINGTRAPELSNIVYSQVPTAEVVTQDSAFGFFNGCVDGGRLREDVRLSPELLFYGQGIYAHTRSEVLGGGCDKYGNQTARYEDPREVENDVWDGQGGVQWDFDAHRSYLYGWAGFRDDTKRTGERFYAEQYVQYTFSKWIAGPHSLEVLGRHRRRYEETQNLRGPNGEAEAWFEGENYVAWKVAPKWVVSYGFEYTSRLGFPPLYNNGSVLYRFTNDSNVRVFVGQQRGGLRCVSGVCRVFPAYEGARIELTLRF